MLKKIFLIFSFAFFLGTNSLADILTGFEALQRKDYKHALIEFEPLAEKGDPIAQTNLGIMYFEGYGLKKNYNKAVKWFEKASAQRYAFAQTLLGSMYENGYGVSQSLIKAYMWMDIAASFSDTNGKILRDLIALKLSSRELAQAKKLVDQCVKFFFKEC